jgi:salicylate hydroxylase
MPPWLEEEPRVAIATGAEAPVLVVGGGIGGLAAALALARRGAHVRVLEQAAQFKEIGAGIQLGPNVFRMFAKLGLTEAVSALAVFPENLILMDSVSAQELTRVPLDQAFRERFAHPYGVIHRADLHQALLAACRGCHRIALETSREVVAIEDDGAQVAVETAQGQRYRGAALVGADGLWSKVRARLLGDGPPRISGHIAYRAVLPTAEMPAHLRWPSMVIWAGEKTHLVHYPLRGGDLFNLVAVFHSDRYQEGWDSFGDPEELHRRFAGTCVAVRTLLAKIESWRMWVLCDREPVREWSRGRVTLLGDAAHPMLQYLAQGACMAIEDAVYLADALCDSRDDVPAALVAYQNARYLRTGRVQLTARVFGEVLHASGVARELRARMLAGRTPVQSHESMAWLYDGP